jgi:hypothetical protein
MRWNTKEKIAEPGVELRRGRGQRQGVSDLVVFGKLVEKLDAGLELGCFGGARLLQAT